MNGILRDTVAELIDRKILYVFLGVTLIAVLVIAATSSVDLRIQVSGTGELGNTAPSVIAQSALLKLFGAFISLLVFLAAMASASLMPSALEKGRVDFYLTKPLSRAGFLLRKYVAIWLTYGGIVVACGLIVYPVAGLVHGTSDSRVAYLFGASLVNLAIWFSITVAAGVLSRSAPIAIMTAFIVWVGQTILAGHTAIGDFIGSSGWKYLVDALYYILPKPSILFDQAFALCEGKAITDWVPLGSSILFAAAMLVAAAEILRRKEF
ncbi:hypothetical protein C3F09_07180 [candidate division GN15 bacterium]|uniref:Uncharacterized protein n=1 Tax=candidate division GN15 bacterium TaxID=2072418 RepID=A0A855X5F2_9BACT|nr:MAG: hypothetical protein C3F09_07180 [candidate division GN15 bacterium]